MPLRFGSGKIEYIAHIDNIKGYETRLDETIEKESGGEVREGEPEIQIKVYDMAEDEPEPLQDGNSRVRQKAKGTENTI